MTNREKQMMAVGTQISREILEAEARGETTTMIGFRLSGMIKGLQIAGVFTNEEATQFIINMKNQFNF